MPGSSSFCVGDWHVEPALNRISRGDEIIKIDPQNMKVLELLASRPGEVFSQQGIEEQVWKGVVVTSNSVYQSIAQLRKALGDERTKPRYIETIPKKGYRLIALTAGGSTVAEAHAASAASETISPVALHIRARSSRLLLLTTLGVALLASLHTRTDLSPANSAPTTLDPTGDLSLAENETPWKRVDRLLTLGEAALTSAQPTTALDYFQTALSEAQAAASGPDDLGLAHVFHQLSRAHLWLDQAHRSAEAAREAVRIFEYHGSRGAALAHTYETLADALAELGRLDDARSYARKAVELSRATRGDTHSFTISAQHTLATVTWLNGDLVETYRLARDVVHTFRAVRPTEYGQLAYYKAFFARVLLDQGDYAAAHQQASEALSLAMNALGEKHPYVYSIKQVFAESLIETGDYSGAQKMLESCIRGLKSSGAPIWRVARAASALAEALAAQGRTREAAGYFSYASRLLDGAPGGLRLHALREHRRRLRGFDHIGQDTAQRVSNL